MKTIQKLPLIVLLMIALLFSGIKEGHCEKKMDNVKAFLLSFAVPGLGQYILGSPGYAKLFIASELAIWSGYYYNNLMKDARSQDYLSYASLHAQVNPIGSGTSYLNAIGAYNSSFEHNMYKQQKSENPVQYSGTSGWNWDSLENRLRFRYLRERELDYENNIKYCIAGVVLNHFLAGLHASKLNSAKTGGISVVVVDVLDQGLGAAFIRRF